MSISEEDGIELEEPEAPAAARKAGVKKLGGQPKVASATGDLNLSTIWASAPDVSEVFK